MWKAPGFVSPEPNRLGVKTLYDYIEVCNLQVLWCRNMATVLHSTVGLQRRGPTASVKNKTLILRYQKCNDCYFIYVIIHSWKQLCVLYSICAIFYKYGPLMVKWSWEPGNVWLNLCFSLCCVLCKLQWMSSKASLKTCQPPWVRHANHLSTAGPLDFYQQPNSSRRWVLV